MLQPDRHGGESYRYNFQGQETDDEIKGKGNSSNYKYRMSDPRLGRFFATDPLTASYPHNSPYAYSENRVIDGVELEGAEVYDFMSNMYDLIVGEEAIKKSDAHTVISTTLNGLAEITDPQRIATDIVSNVGTMLTTPNEEATPIKDNLTLNPLTSPLVGIYNLGQATVNDYNTATTGEGTEQIKGSINLGFDVVKITAFVFGTVKAPVKSSAPSLTAEEALIIEAERVHPTVNTRTLKVGEYATESIPARSSAQTFRVGEQATINRIGSTTGCHTCGSTSSGRVSGNFTPDHQPISKLVPAGTSQSLYPHCSTCSSSQGGVTSGLVRKGYVTPVIVAP